MADDEWVRIKHPDVGMSPNPVQRRSFESTWKDLGWEVVDDLVAEASDLVGAPVTGLEALNKGQLEALAREKGVDLSGAKTNAEIAAAISRAGSAGG